MLSQADHARLLAGLLLAGLGQVALDVARAGHVVVGGSSGGAHQRAGAHGLIGAWLLLLLLLLWLLQVLAEAAWLPLSRAGARLRDHRVQDGGELLVLRLRLLLLGRQEALAVANGLAG